MLIKITEYCHIGIKIWEIKKQQKKRPNKDNDFQILKLKKIKT